MAALGSVAFIFLVILATAKYPGYLFSENYLSDLGVHSEAGLFFFTATILMGLALAAVGALCWKNELVPKAAAGLLVAAGLGLMGVGFFPKEVEPHHSVSAGLTFLSVGLAGLNVAWNWFQEKQSMLLSLGAAVVGLAPLAYVAFFQDSPLAQKIAVSVMVLGFIGLGFWLLKKK